MIECFAYDVRYSFTTFQDCRYVMEPHIDNYKVQCIFGAPYWCVLKENSGRTIFWCEHRVTRIFLKQLKRIYFFEGGGGGEGRATLFAIRFRLPLPLN